MELRHLRYFIRAAEFLHFTRAAESLNVSQPTLSIHIQQLEEELQCSLFERAGRHVRHVRLTEAGSRLLQHARTALHELELGKQDLAELRGLLCGTLRFGWTHVFTPRLMSAALPAYTAEYPGVHVIMKLRRVVEIEHEILSGAIDLGLSWIPPESDEIEYEALFSDELALAVARRHPFAGRTEVSIRELDGLSLALPTSGTNSRRLLEIPLVKENVSPKVVVEIDDIPARLLFVETIGAATIVSRRAAENRPELKCLPITGAHLGRSAGVLKPRGVRLSSAATAFVDTIKTHFQEIKSL
ncbi:MAG: LysR substrate-binding domain-containing protein [Candidatus Korobacteraceae bacterium]|jgi:LysR family cyn operon transcriptional activator